MSSRTLAKPAAPSRDGAAGPVAAADVLVVAVVRDEELLAEGEVPIEAHDQRLPAVLTPTTFLRFER